MNIIDPLAQDYAEKYTSAEDALLREIAAFTTETHPKSHMLSGHLQGGLLQMFSSMIQPKRILEIGTFTGYSALCLAKGLANEGLLHTIEVREEDAATAKRYFDQSFYKEKIILHVGNALEIIGEMDETWDLVFIDADKENYINYFNLVLPKLRPNGFILADNVLFHGQVLEHQIKGKSAKSIQAFNDHLLQRKDIERVLLPVRDGLFIIKKISGPVR
jgi:caffeoyl-CoA O-methyltransferase